MESFKNRKIIYIFPFTHGMLFLLQVIKIAVRGKYFQNL